MSFETASVPSGSTTPEIITVNELSSETPPFAELLQDTALVDALTKLGIVKATAVQAQAIPAALTGSDLVVQAQTGSGKTLAFVLPVIAQLRQAEAEKGVTKKSTSILIVTPTRELANQIGDVIASIAPEIKPVCVIGGANVRAQIRGLKEDARVVVGTPGRLQDLIQQRELVLKDCKHFVLDEADEMLSMGFYEEVTSILSKLPKVRQGLLFSATITPRVESLGRSFLKQAKTILIEKTKESIGDVEHYAYQVDGQLMSKAIALCTVLEKFTPRSSVVFCNTKSETEMVEIFLKRRGFDARRINSDLSQKEREAIMTSLRAEELQVLVATDVAARGLDIDHLDLVVHYNLHDQAETYVHRSGRTGRAGRKGKVVTLVGPRDFAVFHGLKKVLGVEIIPFENAAQ